MMIKQNGEPTKQKSDSEALQSEKQRTPSKRTVGQADRITSKQSHGGKPTKASISSSKQPKIKKQNYLGCAIKSCDQQNALASEFSNDDDW
jgi:hypothetical protein